MGAGWARHARRDMSERVDQRRELSAKAPPGTGAERIGQRLLELTSSCARLEQRVSGRLLEAVQQRELLLPRVSWQPTGVLEQLPEQFDERGALIVVRTTHIDVT